ncbi:hypothetical protein DW083_17950 [Parabacteroides sp. AF48-14]|nr:hypothetical protein DW083_17950 [Parabacteroides sp. AF48-14]
MEITPPNREVLTNTLNENNATPRQIKHEYRAMFSSFIRLIVSFPDKKNTAYIQFPASAGG